MHKLAAPSNLKLISSNDTNPVMRSTTEDNAMWRQSSFGTDRVTIVLLRESEFTQRGAFTQFAKNFRPEFFFDLRLVPRLDKLAGSRATAFRLFDELDVQYFDFSGTCPMEKNITDDDFFISSLSSLVKNNSKGKFFVIFFDDDDIFFRCKYELPAALHLASRPGDKINIAEYRSGLLSMCHF